MYACVRTHLEAELVIVFIEGNVHQTAAEAVVGKQQENVLENVMNLCQVLHQPASYPSHY